VSALVQAPELHRLSIEQYHRLVASGGFDEDVRIELIDGLIVDMSPKTPQHENAVRWLVDWLIGHLDHARYQLMISAPLTIGASEPEPDVAIIERAAPRLEHPSHALLVIEVALSSKDRDLLAKPAVYASAVSEYWVVDVQQRRVVVHRDPADGAYQAIESIPAGPSLRAHAVALGDLPTDELFAAALATASPSPDAPR
jgi:Uma2 family endonuclease